MNCKSQKKIVLMYHRVNDTSSDYNRITVSQVHFAKHMSILQEKYNVLPLRDFLEYEGEETVVTVTFDDGFEDFYTNALPILEQYQIPAAIFVATGKLDTKQEPWTTEILQLLYENNSACRELQVSLCGLEFLLPIATMEQRAVAYRSIRQFLMQLSGEELEEILMSLREQLEATGEGRAAYRMLTTTQCKALDKHPLITVGAHTVNHVSVGRVKDEVVRYEIEESVVCLGQMLGHKIDYFAYPFGGKQDYSKQAIEILKSQGIQAAFTVNASCYDAQQYSVYEIPRFYVDDLEEAAFCRFMEKITTPDDGDFCNSELPETYIGKLADDVELLKSEQPIIIWGTGVRGRRLKEQLLAAGVRQDRLSFADSNEKMWGQIVDELVVLTPGQVAQKDAHVLLYNTHDMQIYKSLRRLGITKIHWIV